MAQTATKAGFRLGIYVFKVWCSAISPRRTAVCFRSRGPVRSGTDRVPDRRAPTARCRRRRGSTSSPTTVSTTRLRWTRFSFPAASRYAPGDAQPTSVSPISEVFPESCLLTSVCTGSWIYARMGLLNGIAATNRKEPDRPRIFEPRHGADRPPRQACAGLLRVSRARAWWTAARSVSHRQHRRRHWRWVFHLLRRKCRLR